jgi:hypothetical protein
MLIQERPKGPSRHVMRSETARAVLQDEVLGETVGFTRPFPVALA